MEPHSEQHCTVFDKNETLKAKGIAICLLLFHHLFYSQDIWDRGGLTLHWLSRQTITSAAFSARVCVWIFAFLSAYGLTIQYNSLGDTSSPEAKLHFIKKHYISMMKPYWFIWPIIMLLSFFIFQPPTEIFEGRMLYALLSFFGLSDFFGTPMPTAIWWYMCFAQILLILLPFFVELCKKYGALALFGLFILVQYLDQTGTVRSAVGSYMDYLFAVLFGVYFAQNGIMEALDRQLHARRYIRVPAGLLLLIGIVFFLWLSMQLTPDIDPWRIRKLLTSAAAVLICIFSFQYITCAFVESVLRFLGRHSGNIFLIHGFLYLYYTELVFWSHNLVLTWITLMGGCLLISMLFEAIKRVMRRSTSLQRFV